MRTKMSRRQAATGLAAGLSLMFAAPAVWWVAQPEPAGQTVTSVNAAAAAELASTFSPATTEAPAPTFAPQSSAPERSSAATTTAPQSPAPKSSAPKSSPKSSPKPATTGAAPKKPAPKAAPAPAPPAPPVRIELPTLGVQAPVIPAGVDSEGVMEIPKNVGEVGWYRFGPAPGAAAGSSVLTGHVDDYQQGVGVFGRLGDLNPGDVVRVSDEKGVRREFSVVSREEWPKDQVPLDRLFDRGGKSRLVLITCGGSFNESTLGYDDNIAITAVPISG
ncbi:class F sortase [Nakamurella sp. GG22]